LYTVVRNLEKHGFIAAVRTTRQGRQPERTVYGITAAGRAEVADWLRELVGVPVREYPRFEAGLSDVGVLPPDEVADLLRQRLSRLESDIAAQRETLEVATRSLPRIFLIEAEYHLALCVAEADWVRDLLREMADGTLSGLSAWRRYHETGQIPDDVSAWIDTATETASAEEGGPPTGDHT
jgi:DNA-binding PadR family transcriptional regulator